MSNREFNFIRKTKRSKRLEDTDDSRSQACSAACISERARTPISCVMYGVRQMTARCALIILVYMMAMYMCVDGPYRL